MIEYDLTGHPEAARLLRESLPDGCESAPAISADGSYVILLRDGESVTAVLGRRADDYAAMVEKQDTHGEGWEHYFVGFLSAFGPYTIEK